jgi:hypothetical protein
MYTGTANIESSGITQAPAQNPNLSEGMSTVNVGIGSSALLPTQLLSLRGGSIMVGTLGTNGGVSVTTYQGSYGVGYRFGQDSATYQRGLYYDTTSGRVSLMNVSGSSQTLQQTVSERLTVLPNGNVGVGTTTPSAPFEVSGNAQMDGNIKMTGTGASITFADGTVQSTAFTGVACSSGGDYAESVDVAGDRKNYEPGDVLVIGAESGSDVLKSAESYSTLVAGIYSTKPGVVGRRQTTDTKTSTTEVPMAMVGIVPTKVSAENGPIKRGDLLVTSSMLGYAMKGTDRSRMLGAVVGKALGALNSGTGVIEVLVTLQ